MFDKCYKDMILAINTILQGVLMIVALVAMVLLLGGMHSVLLRSDDTMNDRAADDLKLQIQKEEDAIMSDKNLFHGFLARENRKR